MIINLTIEAARRGIERQTLALMEVLPCKPLSVPCFWERWVPKMDIFLLVALVEMTIVNNWLLTEENGDSGVASSVASKWKRQAAVVEPI